MCVCVCVVCVCVCVHVCVRVTYGLYFVWILFCRTKYNWFTNENKLNKKEVLVANESTACW